MDFTGKETFRKEFYVILRKKYLALLSEAIDLDDTSPLNGLRYSQIKNKDVARIFVISDAELRSLFVKCIDNGFATKSEIAGLFRVQPHVMTSRVQVGDNALQIVWNNRLEDISDTYEEVPLSMVHFKDKDDNGKEFENGYAINVKKLAAAGMSKTEICRQLQFNPSSYDKIPSLRKAYNEGINLSSMMVADNLISAINAQVIRPKWFEEVYLPDLKRQAVQQTIILWERKYKYIKEKDEDGNPTGEVIEELTCSTKREILVPPNKHAQEIMERLSAGSHLNKIDYAKSKDKTDAIPAMPINTDERGNAIVAEDAEYTVESK